MPKNILYDVKTDGSLSLRRRVSRHMGTSTLLAVKMFWPQAK
jgi:hypothetical protein